MKKHWIGPCDSSEFLNHAHKDLRSRRFETPAGWPKYSMTNRFHFIPSSPLFMLFCHMSMLGSFVALETLAWYI
jgi:hypothetical protein